MFDINQVYKIDNFYDAKERLGFDHFCEHYVWEMDGFSHDKNDVIFWRKNMWEHPKWGSCDIIENTNKQKLQSIFNIKLKTERMYLNGQSHSQCGRLHNDLIQNEEGDFITLIYYVNDKWSPEYGGFTIIIDDKDDMHTIYPKPNSAVIFNSRFAHVGLEPTIHCKTQRVTLAHKFKILKD